MDELKELRKEHEIVADQDYWMPTSSQIEELVEQGYISTPAMEKLEAEIKRRGGNPEYLKGIWGQVSTDKLDQFESINAVMSGTYPTAYKYKAYTASTSNASDTVTATGANGASVSIKANGTTVNSGSAATWNNGSNTVVVTVSKSGLVTSTYTVTVTKAAG